MCVSNGFLLGRGSTAAGVRVFRNRSFVLFMVSKGDVKHSVCVFFAWHGLESCWCFGLFESDADETVSSHRPESRVERFFLLLSFGCFGTEAFLLGMGSNLAGVSVFSNLTLTRL